MQTYFSWLKTFLYQSNSNNYKLTFCVNKKKVIECFFNIKKQYKTKTWVFWDGTHQNQIYITVFDKVTKI